MGKDAGIQRANRPGYVRLADLAPRSAVLAGISREFGTLALQLEPAQSIGAAIQDRPFIDAAIAAGIPLYRKAVSR
jgi:hypothetical protein